MSYETEKAERAVRLFSIILGIVLVITMLSFFDVIDLRRSYCDVPAGFECTGLKVKPTSIYFELENNVAEFNYIDIEFVEHSGCSAFHQGFTKGGDILKIEIKCSITEPQGKTFKDDMMISYETKTDFKSVTKKAGIKSKVVS
jgi:hypothetical protein